MIDSEWKPDDPHLVDPFEIRLHGPEGWCDPVLDILRSHLRPYGPGKDIFQFRNVTTAQLLPVARLVVEVSDMGAQYHDMLFLQAFDIGSRDRETRFFGKVFTRERGDERVEIGMFIVPETAEDIAEMVDLARASRFAVRHRSHKHEFLRIWE